MQGKTHFAIGCAGAVALAAYGIRHEDVQITASALMVPVAVWWPDIDHNNSKLGAQRLEFTKRILTVAKLGMFGYVVFTLLSTTGPHLLDGTMTLGVFLKALLSVSLTIVPILTCIIIATSDKFKQSTKFFTKHRGIMHTLIPIFGMLSARLFVDNIFLIPILMGCAIGYALHLIGDMETVMGAPIFWPLTDKCISILPVRTGTAMEKVVALLDIGGLLWLGLKL